MAAGSSTAWSEDAGTSSRVGSDSRPGRPRGRLAGHRHGVNCVTGGPISTFPALMTFHADRTVSGQAVGPGSTNAYGAGEFGLWSPKEHGRGFTFRLLSYNYNDNGGITGSTEINATAELTSANTFAYKTKVNFYDAEGSLLFSGCGAATGLRF